MSGTVVNAVVVFKQREHLHAPLTYAVRQTMHHFLKHVVRVLREAVQIRALFGTVLNRFDKRILLKV